MHTTEGITELTTKSGVILHVCNPPRPCPFLGSCGWGRARAHSMRTSRTAYTHDIRARSWPSRSIQVRGAQLPEGV